VESPSSQLNCSEGNLLVISAVAATAFRESCDLLAKQAADIAVTVEKLERVTLDPVPLKVPLPTQLAWLELFPPSAGHFATLLCSLLLILIMVACIVCAGDS
jgi:hypothetical protein